MRASSLNQKRKFLQGEKKLEKKHLRLIYIFAIITVAYYYFLEPKTIGHDTRYIIYIFLLPTIIGMIALGIYRRQFLINRFTTNKGFILWTFMIVFYLLQGFIFSYISFGQVAKISWDYFNYRATQNHEEELLTCPITQFSTVRRSRLHFKLNDLHESFRVRYSDIKEYKDKKASDYVLKITARKGIWNYYTMKGWTIEPK
jgi:hypothetical protein